MGDVRGQRLRFDAGSRPRDRGDRRARTDRQRRHAGQCGGTHGAEAACHRQGSRHRSRQDDRRHRARRRQSVRQRRCRDGRDRSAQGEGDCLGDGGRDRAAQARFRFRRRSQYQLSAPPRRADAARHRQRHRRDQHQCRACLRHRRRRHRHQRRGYEPDAQARAPQQDGGSAREGGTPIARRDGRAGRHHGSLLRQSPSVADRQGDHRGGAHRISARRPGARFSSPARPARRASRWDSSTGARPS